MIEINIYSVGSVKEVYLKELISDYQKRISKYANINLFSVADEPNKYDANLVKEVEGKRLLALLKPEQYVILLAIEGTLLTSEEFSRKIDEISTYNTGKIAFIIGGSLGVSKAVFERANFLLSFSKMTFPHQLMKGILLEQIYRSFKILNNETYHK